MSLNVVSIWFRSYSGKIESWCEVCFIYSKLFTEKFFVSSLSRCNNLIMYYTYTDSYSQTFVHVLSAHIEGDGSWEIKRPHLTQTLSLMCMLIRHTEKMKDLGNLGVIASSFSVQTKMQSRRRCNRICSWVNIQFHFSIFSLGCEKRKVLTLPISHNLLEVRQIWRDEIQFAPQRVHLRDQRSTQIRLF